MQIRATERLFLRDKNQTVEPGDVIDLAKDCAQALIDAGRAEAVTEKAAKAAKSEEAS